MNEETSHAHREPVSRELTVAHVREPEGADFAEALFLESARVYELPRSHLRFETLLERLRRAAAEGRVVNVRLPSPDSDVIEDVEVT